MEALGGLIPKEIKKPMSIDRDRRIAECCAFALAEACLARGIDLKPIYKGLGYIRQICHENPSFFDFLKSPLFEADDKRFILKKLKFPKELVEFLDLMITNHYIRFIDLIIEDFSVLYHQAIREIQGVVTVARPDILTASFKKNILKKVEESIGKKADLSYEVNPDLYEGFVLEVGTYFMDASLRGTLNQFRRHVVGHA